MSDIIELIFRNGENTGEESRIPKPHEITRLRTPSAFATKTSLTRESYFSLYFCNGQGESGDC